MTDAAAAAWSAYTTDQGVTYYHNAVTGETTWNKPAALQSESEKNAASGGEVWRWIDDDVDVFVPARELGNGNYQTASGRAVMMHSDQVGEKIHNLLSLERTMADMVQLDEVNDATVLHNLRKRAEADEYFTNVGTILVSVNPYRWQHALYTPEVLKRYAAKSAGQRVPPHFYEIANAAYRGLTDRGTSQSIIISGESGAGKTEATKKCLQFIAEVAGSKFGLEDKLLAANPILEAFGNATTLRNDNSSRFGKWMTVSFDPTGSIDGAHIINYLLEKSRVVIQDAGERNFHVFYQLCKGASSADKQQWSMSGRAPADFSMLAASGLVDVATLNDASNYEELRGAFAALDFAEGEVAAILGIVAGLLWLGNANFERSGDGCVPCAADDSAAAAATAARLLGFSAEELLANVMNRVREVQGKPFEARRILGKRGYRAMRSLKTYTAACLTGSSSASTRRWLQRGPRAAAAP